MKAKKVKNVYSVGNMIFQAIPETYIYKGCYFKCETIAEKPCLDTKLGLALRKKADCGGNHTIYIRLK